MLRVPVARLIEGELELDPDAARYVARVHRALPGDRCVLFDPASAREAEAVVVACERERVVCRVGPAREASIRAAREVTLLQAIGKGDKLDAVVRDATELGATSIVAVETARTVVRLGDRAGARLERLRRVAVEAARQSGRGDAPAVQGPFAWSEAIAPHRASTALRLCLWERATAPIGPHLRDLVPGRAVVVAVGPEGGLEEAEIADAQAAGFAPVSLGPITLRTETVAAAVLGAILVMESR